MEDFSEAANSYMAAIVGTSIRRAIDAVGTSSRCWILDAAASTLDTTLAAESRTMNVVNAVGTSGRRPTDAVWILTILYYSI
jgi:hypothetical protein